MEHHKNAVEGGCFLGLQRFFASDFVWCACFASHPVHGSMLKVWRSGCGGMLDEPKFPTDGCSYLLFNQRLLICPLGRSQAKNFAVLLAEQAVLKGE
jgi:hypothetical protein